MLHIQISQCYVKSKVKLHIFTELSIKTSSEAEIYDEENKEVKEC